VDFYSTRTLCPADTTVVHATTAVPPDLLVALLAPIAFSEHLASLRFVAVTVAGAVSGTWSKCGTDRKDFARVEPVYLEVSGTQRQIYQFEWTTTVKGRLTNNDEIKVSVE